MNLSLKVVVWTVACLLMSVLHSCQNVADSKQDRKISDSEILVDNLESDGVSGATALSDVQSIDWNSPLTRLKHFLDSNGFVTDTTRLNDLADYAYQDLRRSPFIKKGSGVVNVFDKQKHRLSHSKILKNGEGYYFVKTDSNGKPTSKDFGLEFWKIDTSNQQELEQLRFYWKELHRPMPIRLIIQKDNLYVLYSRAASNTSFLDDCKAILESKIR